MFIYKFVKKYLKSYLKSIYNLLFMKNYHLSLMLMVLCLLSSCEDVVNPSINSSKPTFIVDAFLTNEPLPQTIRLTQTIGFLDNSQPQPAVLGATVQITNSNKEIFIFTDEKRDGNYTWKPKTPTQNLGEIGTSFTLMVSNNAETFSATSQVKRTAIFDSLGYEFLAEGKERSNAKEGYYARIYSKNPNRFSKFFGKYIDSLGNPIFARDNIGVGDCYRIKTYRNDTLFMKPQELNLAYDASFSKGGSTDGTSFIFPIRSATTRADVPYKVGDKIQIDIISLTEETFDYLNRVQVQQQNGGLFANPPSNVSTNIININPQSKIQALGWFCVSSRISKTVTVKK